MKTLPHIIAISIIALSCTQTEYIDVEKIIHDTVMVNHESITEKVFSEVDTIKVPIVIPATVHNDTTTVIDTIYQIVYVPVVDSVFIETTVIEVDTFVQVVHHYADTLYKNYQRTTRDIPIELQEIVNEFSRITLEKGLTVYLGGALIIERINELDAKWNSFGFVFYSQGMIKLRESLTKDETLTPIWREMARLYLHKSYTRDGSVMDPEYNPHTIRWSNRSQFEVEINKIFE